MSGKRSALRPDTALAPTGEPRKEIYVYELPVCCLRSLKETVVSRAGSGAGHDRRLLTLDCGCGRSWRITSSLDERVLGVFVTHAGARAGAGGGPPAA